MCEFSSILSHTYPSLYEFLNIDNQNAYLEIKTVALNIYKTKIQIENAEIFWGRICTKNYI